MNKQFLSIIIFFIFFFNQAFSITTYYVATNGQDIYPGNESKPFATITQAVSVVLAGDIIYVRGGTYALTSRINLNKTGNSVALINLWAYPGEKPILDFSDMSLNSSNQGIYLSGSYWYIKGMSVTGAGDNGIKISGNYNKIENCEFFENRDSGLQMDNGASNNEVINCDSYYNADPADYADADGFAAKMDVGSNNYFYGCRAWQNCDDGWDGYLRNTDDVTNSAENCWAFKNGYFKNGNDAGEKANGNGFKMGGSDDDDLMHHWTLKNCLAFDNKGKGFDQNNNKGSMTLLNCIGYSNLIGNYVISSALSAGQTLNVKNCVSLGPYGSLGSFAIQATNSWLGSLVVDNSDFLSIDKSEAYSSRQEDGSLPNMNFLHLAAGSDLINAGTDVGIPFIGNFPDLGAWETNVVTSIDLISNSILDFVCVPSLVKDHTWLRFVLSNSEDLNILVISIDGKILKNEGTKYYTAGKHELFIDFKNVSSGYYVCKLIAGKEIYYCKIVKQ